MYNASLTTSPVPLSLSVWNLPTIIPESRVPLGPAFINNRLSFTVVFVDTTVVVAPFTVKLPFTTVLPKTFKLPLIPTPPFTNNAPELTVELIVVLFIITFPPIFVFFAIPTPPEIIITPLETLVLWSVPLNVPIPVPLKVPTVIFVTLPLTNDKLADVKEFIPAFPVVNDVLVIMPLTCNVLTGLLVPIPTLPPVFKTI